MNLPSCGSRETAGTSDVDQFACGDDPAHKLGDLLRRRVRAELTPAQHIHQLRQRFRRIEDGGIPIDVIDKGGKRFAQSKEEAGKDVRIDDQPHQVSARIASNLSRHAARDRRRPHLRGDVGEFRSHRLPDPPKERSRNADRAESCIASQSQECFEGDALKDLAHENP
jgi:hypothetical protein